MTVDILEKIKKIEALIVAGTTEGERNAALLAKQRLLDNYTSTSVQEKEVEWTLRTPGKWHKKLLVALCNKYEVKPYRYSRQKYTTVMIRCTKQFVETILWPEYLKYSNHLEILLDEIADDLINKIHLTEAEEVIIQGELK